MSLEIFLVHALAPQVQILVSSLTKVKCVCYLLFQLLANFNQESFLFLFFLFFLRIYQESNLIMLKASKCFLFYYFWHKIRSISCEVWSWNVTYFQLYKWMLMKFCFTNCIKGYATSTFKWIKSELHKIGRVW